MKFNLEYDPAPNVTINLYHSLEPFFEEFKNCSILIFY